MLISLKSFRPLLVLSFFLLVSACGDGAIEAGTTSAAPDPSRPGPYPVGVTRIELYDEARDRTLLTEVWYPAWDAARGLPASPATSYLPPDLGFLAENSTIPLVAVRDVAFSEDGPFPLIGFSHGSGGIRFQNTFQCEHLASHGFVVVAPDHQGNTFFDSSGTPEELRINRPLDMIYVFDQMAEFTARSGHPFEDWVDLDRGFGITGHSFGAFTTMAVASMDSRIVAALPMALGGPVSDTFDAATLLMLATVDVTIGPEGNDGVRATYDAVPGPRFLAELVDAGHYSFSFACQTGLGIGDGDGCGTGTRFDGSEVTFVSDMRVWDIVKNYSAALFGRYIKGVEAYDEVLATTLDPEINRYVAEPNR